MTGGLARITFRAAFTFAVGGVGGGLFFLLNLPLPWLLGALCATMVACFSGAPVEIRPGLRKYLIVILGIVLGGTFTPEVLDRVGEWVPTLIAAVGYLGVVTFTAQLYCRRVLGMDKVTAIFSGMPGGLSEMVILGEEHGADVKALTLTHAVRVASVLLAIPFFLTYWVGLESHAVLTPPTTWSLQDGIILVATAVVGVAAGKIIHMPAYYLTGPLLASAGVHLSGLVISAPPESISLAVQLAMGSALGTRFFGVSVVQVGRLMLLATGMAITMMAVTLVSAGVLSFATDLSFEALVLALSPGGFAEMTLAALSMDIDPAFVTTHHGVRLLVVVFIAPMFLSYWVKKGCISDLHI